jgi:hypothetical protein
MFEEELPENIQNEVTTLTEVTSNEITFIKSKDWVNDPDRSSRMKKYKLHARFTDNAVENATKFYAIAKDYVHYESVKGLLTTFIEFVDIFSKNFENYKKLQVWTNYPDTTDEELIAIEVEATFQSDILNQLQTFKNKLKKIDISDADSKLNKVVLPIFQDTPLGIMLMDQVFERYPITEVIVNKKLSMLEVKEIEEKEELPIKKVKVKKDEKVPTKKVSRGVRSKRS